MSAATELVPLANGPARRIATMSDNPITHHSVGDIEVMAKQVAQSRLFGLDPAQAFTLMILSQAKGLHPIQAVERYHVIQGRPAMKADAMLAEFQSRGGIVEWVQHDATRCEAVWEAPGVKTPVTVAWTMEDAKKAELLKSPMWHKFPRQMLRARVISEGIRMTMPGILSGIYTPEEVMDFAPEKPSFSNGTDYGSGKYADPDTVKAYQSWLRPFAESINAKWLDHWTDRDTGELPNTIGDLINPWRLSNHLCKWARETGQVEAPEDFKVAQTDRLVAIVFGRDRAAVETEAKNYCKRLWREARAKYEASLNAEDESQDVPDDDLDTTDDGTAYEREPGEDDA